MTEAQALAHEWAFGSRLSVISKLHNASMKVHATFVQLIPRDDVQYYNAWFG